MKGKKKRIKRTSLAERCQADNTNPSQVMNYSTEKVTVTSPLPSASELLFFRWLVESIKICFFMFVLLFVYDSFGYKTLSVCEHRMIL